MKYPGQFFVLITLVSICFSGISFSQEILTYADLKSPPAEMQNGTLGTEVLFPTQEPVAMPITSLSEADQLDAISISAWIKPTGCERYNEIFRQECPQRILFAFQENATVLALGLNIDGYLECDAPIDCDALLDGDWHFVAATFDGEEMKVFLDGAEIHKQARKGKVAFNRNALAFVGSSGGRGEFFQGTISSLVISSSCISEEKIHQMFLDGMAEIDKEFEETNKELAKFYIPCEDFLETLVQTRKQLHDYRKENACEQLDPKLLSGLRRKLKKDFTLEKRDFVRIFGFSPTEYVTTADIARFKESVAEKIAQMTEYMPLTESQWHLVSAREKPQWEAVRQLREKLEKLDSFDDADSIRTMSGLLETGQSFIQERPTAREAVAPFRLPATAKPKLYTENEADELIRQDWLHQCDNDTSPKRVLQETDWAIALAERLLKNSGQTDKNNSFLVESLEKLKEHRLQVRDLIRKNAFAGDESRELYFAVREIKRQVQLNNPAVDFSQILLVDMPFPDGSEWQHETRHRLGYMAVPGGQLLVLDGLQPDANVRRLMPQEPLHGSFWRPDLSFDGKRVLFSFKPHNEKAFHIYEIDLDGTNLRQITAGIFDDLDPVYLPDGKNFVFSTTRGYTYVRCMPPTNAFVLARCALDGDDVYLISQNNEPDYLPSVMDDGRVIYTRWEYTDKPLWRCQSLWTTNPDGTQHNTFWGNQSVWPDLLKDARNIPGSRRVMFTGSAHHNWFAGSIGIINPDEGANFPDGLTKVTADVSWPECGDGPLDPVESPDYHVSGKYSAYYSPYPLSENDFLVSANKNGKFVLYLMDVDGNRELIYEGVNNIFHAIPIRARKTPPVLPDRTEWPTYETRDNPTPGTIYSGNVYHGAPDVLRDKAKYLRVLHIEQKTYTLWDQRPYISTGPVVSMIQSEGVKRILGTVPIEEDGSVWFEAPSGIALHFQLLDENHLALQTMRSFTGLMPGESRGCLGCHEQHSMSPDMKTERPLLAMLKAPEKITPVSWAENQDQLNRYGTSVSYLKDVRPILDQYCAECHQGDGEGRETFDMTPRDGFLMFEEPYVTMIGAPNWGAPGRFPTGAWGGGRKTEGDETYPPGFNITATLPVEAFDQRDPAAYTTPEPMTYLSRRSRLIEIASSGEHHDIKVDPESLMKLIVWIDAVCPYIDDTHIRSMPDPNFQGSKWLSVPPRLESAPVVPRPGPFSAKYEDAESFCELSGP